MKLFEVKAQTFDAQDLIAEARKVGEKLYGKSHTGLVMADQAQVMKFSEYFGGDSGQTYDTFDYLFRPAKDVADDEVDKNDARNGIFFIAGADGVKLVTLPGVKAVLTNQKEVKSDAGEPAALWVVTTKTGHGYHVKDNLRMIKAGKLTRLPDTEEAVIKHIKKHEQAYGMQHIANTIVSARKGTPAEMKDDMSIYTPAEAMEIYGYKK